MVFGILTFLIALSISAVAIYYSVAGLVAIFAAAAIPIIIMGSVLEVGKLVAAVWLHRYWHRAAWWLKTYLSVAVMVLMFITSMGIFGFLSKAHIEQTAVAEQSQSEIVQIDEEISFRSQTVARLESEIDIIESKGSSQDQEIQAQIDKEQERINAAQSRIQPAIDEQLALIKKTEDDFNSRILELQSQISSIDQNLQNLQNLLNENNIRGAQALLGIRQDGSFGPATQRAIEEYRSLQNSTKQDFNNRIETLRNDLASATSPYRTEIQRIRSLSEQEIADSNQLISRLRQQLGTVDLTRSQIQIDSLRSSIEQERKALSDLRNRKFELETAYRQLEAEVGPVKYIAEFVYGDADQNLLEQAVRWVIIIIIFVFDPMAVVLLIASQYTFEYARHDRAEKKEEVDVIQQREETRGSGETETSTSELSDKIEPAEAGRGHEGRSLAVRERELDELEEDEQWRDAKHRWKIENPNDTLKAQKQKYLNGEIDRLPWEDYVNIGYVQNGEQNKNSIWTRIRDRHNE